MRKNVFSMILGVESSTTVQGHIIRPNHVVYQPDQCNIQFFGFNVNESDCGVDFYVFLGCFKTVIELKQFSGNNFLMTVPNLLFHNYSNNKEYLVC